MFAGDALDAARGTFYEDKLCTCEYFYTSNPIKVDGKTEIMPDPPPCDKCGKWARHLLRECGTCRSKYYRWFQYPISFNKEGLDCWDCTVRKALDRLGHVAQGTGVIAPSQCLIAIPKTTAEISDELDALLGSF